MQQKYFFFRNSLLPTHVYLEDVKIFSYPDFACVLKILYVHHKNVIDIFIFT